MTETRVVCSKCGKPLDNIPDYMALGEGAGLFQCEECFYPGCEQARPAAGKVGLRRRLDSLVEDLEKELQTVDS